MYKNIRLMIYIHHISMHFCCLSDLFRLFDHSSSVVIIMYDDHFIFVSSSFLFILTFGGLMTDWLLVVGSMRLGCCSCCDDDK
mmetsp:Transcript_36531/g.63737  ORF Transcript_36531/g.63737 Transcript_36531/m.63737 type:complete len:83 (+) Transcript_36531:724-972(+)